MKNAQLTHGLLMALLMGTTVASAQDYPAADFQPKMVYQDPSIVASAPAAKNSAPAAPAATPCPTKEEKIEAQATEADPRYPAANFQPKVIFSN